MILACRWIRDLCLGFALVAVLTCCATRATAAQNSRPNVVLILIDDLGWGDLACYGNEIFKTPTFDQMAAEGARLTAFYSCTPEGVGSRVALHTGRYPFRTGLVKTPSPDGEGKSLGLPADELTLGKAFASAGYMTACIGKWQFGSERQYMPLQNGYQQYLGLLHNNDEHPVKLYAGNSVTQSVVMQPKLTDRYTETALRFIESNHQRPFFLYLSHSMLHKPLAPSDEFFGRFPGGIYGDTIAQLDDSTRQILEKLKELNLDENTIVIVTSDNGPWFGGSTGGLRGMKSTTWEGGIRVPLIARWPGRIPEGHTSDEMAGLMDLFPTLLGAAGIAVPSDRPIDGRDIMPLLVGDAPSPHQALFSFSGEKLCTVRVGKMKLHGPASGPRVIVLMDRFERWIDPRRPDRMRIIAPTKQPHPSEFPGVATGFATEGYAVVDLEKDPSEQEDIAGSRKDLLAELQSVFDTMLAELPESARKASTAMPKEASEGDEGEKSAKNEPDKPDDTKKPKTDEKPKKTETAAKPENDKTESNKNATVDGKTAEEWAVELRSAKVNDRATAMAMLAKISRVDARAVPLLAEGLKDSEALNRRVAAGLLKSLGPQAWAAIPALKEAAKTDPNLKLDVDAAIKAIEGP